VLDLLQQLSVLSSLSPSGMGGDMLWLHARAWPCWRIAVETFSSSHGCGAPLAQAYRRDTAAIVMFATALA